MLKRKEKFKLLFVELGADTLQSIVKSSLHLLSVVPNGPARFKCSSETTATLLASNHHPFIK